MRLLWRWIERYGIPGALYTDKKNVVVTDREPTVEEQLAGEEPMTAFGKACTKLGIETLVAHSPRAKGRVERSTGVYQDRLVKEVRLRGVTPRSRERTARSQQASQRHSTPRLSASQRRPTDFHRRAPTGLNLAEVFCWEETRTVHNDWTIRYNNRFYQILKENQARPTPGEKGVVRVLLDETMQMLYRDTKLSYEPIAQPPPRKTQKGTCTEPEHKDIS